MHIETDMAPLDMITIAIAEITNVPIQSVLKYTYMVRKKVGNVQIVIIILFQNHVLERFCCLLRKSLRYLTQCVEFQRCSNKSITVKNVYEYMLS